MKENKNSDKGFAHPKNSPLYRYYEQEHYIRKLEKSASARKFTKTGRLSISSQSELIEIWPDLGPLNDLESRVAERRSEVVKILKAKPNFFLTVSRPGIRNYKELSCYPRFEETFRCCKTTAVLMRKLFLMFRPELQNIPYSEWPFFVCFMEHRSKDGGSFVAPHMHILFRLDGVDFVVLDAMIRSLWNTEIKDDSANGVELRIIDPDRLLELANYVTKHGQSDGVEKL